jgi:predicted metal-dependent hydrolase
VKDRLLYIFQQAYSEIRPRSPLPEMRVQFFAFTSIKNTIRMREGRLLVRLSDLLEGAPETVLQAIAHILLAKVYRKAVQREAASRYRRYVSSRVLARKAHLVRQMRGRKHLDSPRGQIYDLESVFDELNSRYFHGLLARPLMTWSRDHARNSLGHYDPAHNAIMVSRIFDRPNVPRYAVDYIVYHEMLHLKHPVKLRGSRRCVHSAEFQAEEKLFPRLADATRFLRQL